MTAGPRPLVRPVRLLLALAVALVIWLAFHGRGLVLERRGVDPAAPERIVADLQDAATGVLRAAASIADTALEGSPWGAEEAAARGPLARPRLEGVGVLDSGGTYLNWRGTPVEPAEFLTSAQAPRWVVRRDGIRTRLIVRAGPDEFGFVALASFILDAPAGTPTIRDLLPLQRRDADVRVTWLDTREVYEQTWLDPQARLELSSREPAGDGVLVSPAGDVRLAAVSSDPLAPGLRARRLRRAGEAWAAVALVLLFVAGASWRRLSRGDAGLLLTLGALTTGRALLVAVHAPGRLLPREWGSPSLYGQTGVLGLFASPADLLLSALALTLACLAVRTRLRGPRREGRRPLAAAVAAAAAAGATLALWAVSRSLASHARIELLTFEGITRRDGPALLLVAWAVVLVGASILWGAAWSGLRPRLGARALSQHAPAFLAVAPLALVAAATLYGVSERVAFERLRLEFAPAVVDQEAQRRITLIAAIREAAAELGAMDGPGTTPRSDRLAFELWYGTDLFHSGYRSSIDVYAGNGEPVASFGFDLPPVVEETIPAAGDRPELGLREEVLPVGALQQRLLHAEVAVHREDGPDLILIGHVLDEPANLPFLSASEPYLTALGAETSPRGAAGEKSTPEYVLYDRRGSVLLRTVDQPPTLTREMELAATLEQSLRVRAGEDDYLALPLLDGDLLHLLMTRSPSLVERLGGAARLALLAISLMSAAVLAAGAARPGVVERVSRGLRGSFYRKLLLTLLLASVLPLVGLSLFVRGYIESRATATVVQAAVRYVSVAQRVIEDFIVAELEDGTPPELDDSVLHWLRRLVGQEIHVYRDGRLVASSKRELFSSGLLPERLPGSVQEELVRVGLPYLVLPTALGSVDVPVAYAPLSASDPAALPAGQVVAVPLTLQRDDLSRSIDLVVEVLLLATVALACGLALIAAFLARTVARPVRDLVGATGRIAAGDYSARLETRAKDEIADLVEGFNAMASSLAAQRADLERRRDYMEALLRNATTGVVSTDAAGRIVTVNPAMAALLDVDPGELRGGSSLSRALEAHAELAPIARTIALPPERLREPLEVDLEREGRPGRFRVVRVDLPDPFGDAPGSLFLMDDVTELMRSNQLAAWAEMARAIAHEIKNPLTPIQLSTEHLQRLLRDRGVTPAAEIDSCLETVMKQVRALYQIAAEFSTYAKLPALAPQARDPVEFLKEVIAPYRTAPPAGVRIEERYAEAPPIHVDRRVLGRAVINLIENALQAMPQGGVLTVGVERDADSVLLSVADTGAGLEPEVRARLFEPYFSTKSSGTGLGLAIVRRSVEAHGGTIEVASTPGRGSTFRIRLPVYTSPR